MSKLLHSLTLLFAGLLLSQSAFAQVVSWGSTQNIPLGGVSTILMILTMLGLGTFIFPKLKSNTLKSFFVLFMAGGVFAVVSSTGLFSSLQAQVVTPQVIITTPSGSQHITGGTTEIINNYSQAVPIRIDPQECSVSVADGQRIPLATTDAITVSTITTTTCATSQSLPAGQACAISLNCPTVCPPGAIC